MPAMRRPGGEVSNRPLHFIWIADCSGSMFGGKVASLNTAIREAIPHMKKVASENPNAQVLVRAISFSSGARWHIASPEPVEDFQWRDLSADGLTDMGQAMLLLKEALNPENMGVRALPPVLVLVSDGQPTDDFHNGLHLLMQEPWAKKAVRMAIAIGEDADHQTLQEFIGNPELKVLQANSPETLVKYIRWVSTAVLQQASAPTSQVNGNTAATIATVQVPTIAAVDDNEEEVW